MFLKQSTSAVVLVGPVLDASGVAVTTAVIGDFTLSKNGTSAAMSGNTISHSHNGHYAITLTSGNTDTIGRLTISVNNTAQAMPVFRWDICQPTVYDALFTNATNTTGGLPTATAAITALAGAVSTYAGGDTAGTTTLLSRLPSAITLTAGRVTANTDQWGGVSVTGMPLPTSSYTAPPAAAAIADAVWDEAMSTHTVNGSYGSHVVRSANQNQNTVAITGSQHVASDVHELQAAVITADKFAANWLTAAGTAADYITELQTALGTAANQTAILDRVSFCLSTLAGACSDAQTAAETYVLTIGGNTYTVDYSGLDASGNRSTTTLTKA